MNPLTHELEDIKRGRMLERRMLKPATPPTPPPPDPSRVARDPKPRVLARREAVEGGAEL